MQPGPFHGGQPLGQNFMGMNCGSGMTCFSEAKTTVGSCNPGGFESEAEISMLRQKISLLEHKCKSKDQLFEDSLASTTIGVCGSSGSEFTNLVAKLKKRVLKLRARLTQSDKEIVRLTKTVKVVEIEVREDNEPLRLELIELKRRNSELEFELANRHTSTVVEYDRSEE